MFCDRFLWMEVTERQRQAALPGLLNSAYVKWREIQTPVQPGVITYAISYCEFPKHFSKWEATIDGVRELPNET